MFNAKGIVKDDKNCKDRAMNERLATGHLDQDPSKDIAARNQELERLLNPENGLPEVDVYPVLGGTFSHEDLENKYPEGTLLPLQEALDTDQGVTLVLGYSGRNAADITLQPVDGTRLWRVIDTWVPGGDQVPEELSLRGLGLGKRLFLELFKHLPMGSEVTHNQLTPTDGKRMWAWLEEKGIAVKPNGDMDGAPGEYVTRLNELVQELDEGQQS